MRTSLEEKIAALKLRPYTIFGIDSIPLIRTAWATSDIIQQMLKGSELDWPGWER
jgi:hypothetical protein